MILLTNVVHPKRGKSLSALRSKVATIVAASMGIDAPGVSVIGYNETLEGAGVRRMISPNHEVLTGLDVLEQEQFAPLEGKRVGLITNQTGRDREGRRNVDAMIAGGVKVTELFSPEHGINGGEDRPDVADSKDAATGLKIWSLHDNGRYRMTPEMLGDVDALVYDIQDAGVRFYTYSSTMLYAHGGGRQSTSAVLCSGSSQPGHRRACGRPAARRGPAQFRRMLRRCRCATA